MKATALSLLPPGLALGLFVLGLALILEWIRPFRDLQLDGPIAIACWVAGVLLAGAALWLRQGWPALNIVALAPNVLALAAAIALYIIMSRNDRLF